MEKALLRNAPSGKFLAAVRPRLEMEECRNIIGIDVFMEPYHDDTDRHNTVKTSKVTFSSVQCGLLILMISVVTVHANC